MKKNDHKTTPLQAGYRVGELIFSSIVPDKTLLFVSFLFPSCLFQQLKKRQASWHRIHTNTEVSVLCCVYH